MFKPCAISFAPRSSHSGQNQKLAVQQWCDRFHKCSPYPNSPTGQLSRTTHFPTYPKC
jgi:hypothetical protein